jgi:monoamine oxidase
MQRRNFIKNVLYSTPIFLMSSSILTSCNKENIGKGKTVIVIGAGISGLAAANKLKSRGFTVSVLEAQDRVGGRLRTDRSLGVAFDEGASWIHGINGNPMTSLAKDAGASTAYTDDSSRISYDMGGITRADAVYEAAETELYNSVLKNLKNNGAIDKSFEAVFNAQYPQYQNDRLWKFFLSTYITFDTGDLDKLSSLNYDEGKEYGGDEHIMTEGYDKIPTYLAKDINVKLNERVSQIDYVGNVVKISSSGGTYEADYVLVTVPLGVLKSNKISFSPALPDKKITAIQKVGVNCVNKFLLTWDTAFWDDIQYISYTPDVKDKFNYFVNVKKFHPNVNALMTFAYADAARQTENMTDAQVISEIMTHLKDIYGSAIPEPTHLLRTKWQSNENSYGAYSYTAVGTEMQHFDDLAEEVSDKLFFAGEHTEIDYFSTAHGAYLSGIREADKIIKLQ